MTTRYTCWNRTPIHSSRAKTKWRMPPRRRDELWRVDPAHRGEALKRVTTGGGGAKSRGGAAVSDLRAELNRFWSHCPYCGRSLVWRDTPRVNGAECHYCSWVVSDRFSFCPWCGGASRTATPVPSPSRRPKASSLRAAAAGVRRRRDVPDEELPVVRARAEMAV